MSAGLDVRCGCRMGAEAGRARNTGAGQGASYRQCVGRSRWCTFEALAWAERDSRQWELPLPVSITDNGRPAVDDAAAYSGY